MSNNRRAMPARSSAPPCPMCSGYGVPLGTLGAINWFRCRHCGWDFGRRRRLRSRRRETMEQGVRDAPIRGHNAS